MKESDFSTELICLAKIYEYNYVRYKPIWYGRLWRCVKGKMKQGAMDRALLKMADLGMIDSEWGKVDNKWTRKFTVSSECKDFAKKVYRRIKECKNEHRRS